MDKFKPCKISDVIQGKFSIGGSSGDASYIYVNGASATSRLVKDAIEHAVNSHDQLVDTIAEQEKVISELVSMLESIECVLDLGVAQNGNGALGRYRMPIKQLLSSLDSGTKHKQSKGD